MKLSKEQIIEVIKTAIKHQYGQATGDDFGFDDDRLVYLQGSISLDEIAEEIIKAEAWAIHEPR